MHHRLLLFSLAAAALAHSALGQTADRLGKHRGLRLELEYPLERSAVGPTHSQAVSRLPRYVRTYTWDRQSRAWSPDSLRSGNGYSPAGTLSRQASYRYLMADSSTRYEFQQDAAERDTAIVHYKWRDREWKPVSKAAYRFDLYGNQTLAAQYDFDSAANRFALVRAFANQYRYDASQRLTEKIDLQTDQNGLFKPSLKTLYAYPGADNGYVSVEFQRPEANNRWQPWYKYADLIWYDYDKRLPLLYNRYDHNGSAYELGARFILAFLDSHNYSRRAELVTAGGNRADYREMYSRIDTTRLYTREDSTALGWTFNTRTTQVNDRRGNPVRVQYESFLTGVWRTTGGNEWKYLYDAQNDLVEEEIWAWMLDSSRFEPQTRYRYDAYFDFVVSVKTHKPSISLTIHPVPAQDWVTVEGIKALKSVIAVDGVGRAIPLPIDGNRVDVSGLKAGLYQFRGFGQNGTIYQGRFVKG